MGLFAGKKAVNFEQRLQHRLQEELEGMSCSVGISIYPLDSQTSESFFRNADLALYRAKNSGRGHWS